MKFLLLLLIRTYWLLTPENKRRRCIFKESCSNFVYRITRTEGGTKGVSALKLRFQQCRPGYAMVRDEASNLLGVRLKDGTFVPKAELRL
jgi:putative component of membrane protein insertase Oxa1/YidC/SpoIIIJ protein YidD